MRYDLYKWTELRGDLVASKSSDDLLALLTDIPYHWAANVRPPYHWAILDTDRRAIVRFGAKADATIIAALKLGEHPFGLGCFDGRRHCILRRYASAQELRSHERTSWGSVIYADLPTGALDYRAHAARGCPTCAAACRASAAANGQEKKR